MWTGAYWNECWASVDMVGDYVYWGGNWQGKSNIEIYRARLDWPGSAPPVPDLPPTDETQEPLWIKKRVRMNNNGKMVEFEVEVWQE